MDTTVEDGSHKKRKRSSRTVTSAEAQREDANPRSCVSDTSENTDSSKRARTRQVRLPPFVRTVEYSNEEKSAYRLNLFGLPECVCDPVLEEVSIFFCEFHEGQPFVIGRPLFAKLKFSAYLESILNKARISRNHFEIYCDTNEDTGEREFWLEDGSSNGTQVNGELVGKGNRIRLQDGDRITLLMTLPLPSTDTLIGYVFHSINRCAPEGDILVNESTPDGKMEPDEPASFDGPALIQHDHSGPNEPPGGGVDYGAAIGTAASALMVAGAYYVVNVVPQLWDWS